MEEKYQLIRMTRIISETIKTKKLNEKNTHTHTQTATQANNRSH